MRMERLVNVYRGREIESFHSGSVAVVDATGRLLAFCGDPQMKTFLRSAAKPFQILPLLEAGGGAEFDLSSEELALICASHAGTTVECRPAAAARQAALSADAGARTDAGLGDPRYARAAAG